MNYSIIGGNERCGKTYELIKKSSKEWLCIVCATDQQAEKIFIQAKSMGLNIPYPITADELLINRNSYIPIKKVLVDEIEQVLETAIQKPIVEASTSMNMKVMDSLCEKKIFEDVMKQQLEMAEDTYNKLKKAFETKQPIFITTRDIYTMEFLFKRHR